jgi:hypothetical protein
LVRFISYAASMERRQFEAFREGKLKSGHIPLTVDTLDQLQAVFSAAIERLRPYCRSHFRQLSDEYERAKSEVAEVDRRLDIVGSGAVKTRQKLLYQRRTIRAKHRLAFQMFEDDYERFKHDQTYAGTQQEDHFEDIFCTNTAYVALSRLIFVRICEDVGFTTRKISNSGIAVWRRSPRINGAGLTNSEPLGRQTVDVPYAVGLQAFVCGRHKSGNCGPGVTHGEWQGFTDAARGNSL